MCNELNHPRADDLGLADHDHQDHAEAQLTAAFVSELGSEEQRVALELARVEALLAIAHELHDLRGELQTHHLTVEQRS